MKRMDGSPLNLALVANLVLLTLASQAASAADYQIAFRMPGEPYRILVMEADGANQTVVHEEGGGHVSWSHDGKSLAFRDSVGIVRIDGVDQGQFDPEATVVVPRDGACIDGIHYWAFSFVGDPRWSPVRDEIAFTAVGDGYEMLCVAPASGGDPELVTFGIFEAGRLAWNADGTQIAFIGGDRRLYIVDRTTGIQVRDPLDPPVDDSWYNLDWARNDAAGDNDPRIAFQTTGFKNTWIYTIDTETSDFEGPLVYGTHPSWSPDNSQLVFADTKGRGAIKLLTLATEEVEELVTGAGGPDWRPAPLTCTGDTDCDDGNPCTDDECISLACHHDPVTDGETRDGCGGECWDGVCAIPECSVDADCADDTDICTVPVCRDAGLPWAVCDFDMLGCGPADGCCPAGCDGAQDIDCPSCLAKGEVCSSNDDCCSGLCHPVKATCK